MVRACLSAKATPSHLSCESISCACLPAQSALLATQSAYSLAFSDASLDAARPRHEGLATLHIFRDSHNFPGPPPAQTRGRGRQTFDSERRLILCALNSNV